MKTGTELIAEKICNDNFNVVEYLGYLYFIFGHSFNYNIVILSSNFDSHEYDLMDVANCGTFYKEEI